MADSGITPQSQRIDDSQTLAILATLRQSDKDFSAQGLAALNTRMEHGLDALQKLLEARIESIALREDTRWEAQTGADVLRQRALEAALAAAKEAVAAALIAAEKAVDKAERAQELRNQVANEFRATLDDQNKRMWERESGRAELAGIQQRVENEVESMRRELSSELKTLEGRVTGIETSFASAQVLGLATGVVAVEVTINTAGLSQLPERIRLLETAMATAQGRNQMLTLVWGVVVLAISIGIRFVK